MEALSTAQGQFRFGVHATALERAGLGSLQEGQSVRVGVVQGTKGAEVSTISLL
jgi:cold shock CspA family protein